jgi:SAM-dependent methyltransferase
MTESGNRWLRTKDVSGDAYDARYDERAAAGENVHGEADLVMRYAPATVLDAGCGTGRIARELARRGVDTVGVDLDPEMLATARRRAPELTWVLADLASIDLDRTFDLAIAAGNVMILLTPGTEGAVLTSVARHVRTGGLLIAGFQLRESHLTLAEYDRAAAAAGFALEDRWATWEREPWRADSGYAVSAHRLLERADGGHDQEQHGDHDGDDAADDEGHRRADGAHDGGEQHGRKR